MVCLVKVVECLGDWFSFHHLALEEEQACLQVALEEVVVPWREEAVEGEGTLDILEAALEEGVDQMEKVESRQLGNPQLSPKMKTVGCET